MHVSDVRKTRAGKRSVFVFTDTPETRFSGNVKAKKNFRSRWIRLTGPAIDAVSHEEARDGRQLEEWLPRNADDPAKLAVAQGVVVAFPVLGKAQERPDWKLIPGPASSKLAEVALPQAVSPAQPA